MVVENDNDRRAETDAERRNEIGLNAMPKASRKPAGSLSLSSSSLLSFSLHLVNDAQGEADGSHLRL